MKKTKVVASVVTLACLVPLAACSTTASKTTAADAQTVTVKNCNQEVTYKRGSKLMVNDSNIIAMALAAGARPQITAVTVNEMNKKVLDARYGEDSKSLKVVDVRYPSMETIIAQKPDVMVAGWNYGFSESKNMTPQILKEKGFDSYILSESCRQSDNKTRGIIEPWEAVRTDVANLGKISGHDDTATAAINDLNKRLEALQKAPKATNTPTVFVFDSAKDSIFTSGDMGGPQAVITAAGGKNSNDDIHNTWTTVGWEKIAKARPDVIVFVDYPGQSFQDKVAVLKSNPATKDLPAVQQNRFLNLAYVSWCSGPMNIDAAEALRVQLESFGLMPKSEIKPAFDLVAQSEQYHG